MNADLDSAQTELQTSDTVVAIMGVTGSGKSTFVSKFVGDDAVPIGHTLKSETKYTCAYRFQHETFGDIHLIDTPGFDDTYTTDADVLREIASFMSKTYESNVRLAGIIYLHDVTRNRVGGSALKNLRMFKRLCGEDAYKHVVLATSMWVAKDDPLGVEREQQLVTDSDFWKDMHDRGSSVKRWYGDVGSAEELFEHLLSARQSQGPVTLQIQRELVDEGKELSETSAGRELNKVLIELQRKWEEQLQDVLDETKEAIFKKDEEWQKELQEERQRLEAQRQKAEEGQQALKVSLERLLAENEKKYLRLADELRTSKEDIEKHSGELQRLHEENLQKEESLQAQIAKEEITEQEKRKLEEEIRNIKEAKKREEALRKELDEKKKRQNRAKKIALAIPKILIPLVGAILAAVIGVDPIAGFS